MPSFWSSREFDSLFVCKGAFKSLEKQENISILSSTPSHCTLMNDSVQWLSQSDYSNYISVQLQFY